MPHVLMATSDLGSAECASLVSCTSLLSLSMAHGGLQVPRQSAW